MIHSARRRYPAAEVRAALAQGQEDYMGLCAAHVAQQCRCLREANPWDPPGKPLPTSVECAAGVLSAALLSGWEAVRERPDRAGRAKAALELLLHLHLLSSRTPGAAGEGLREEDAEIVTRLFSALGISLIGEAMSTRDVFTDVLLPCWGAHPLKAAAPMGRRPSCCRTAPSLLLDMNPM